MTLRALAAAALVLFFFTPRCLLAETTGPAEIGGLAGLTERSRNVDLSGSRDWLKLIHYERSAFGSGWLSVVDDPAFFLAPDGKRNPESELQATLTAFFSSDLKGPAGQTAQCAFPARYAFLKSRLNFAAAGINDQRCDRFEDWRDSLNAGSLTLIYPAAYINNPASMFGHTLIRLDARGQTESTRLLAYGATFAAATNESSGLLFAFRGIFGGYLGLYSVQPYYKQVRDYNDIENRDIWEYELNLSPEEVAQTVRHLWELGSVWFDYYFFDENCSYQLLALLEGAAPRLHLTDEFPLWAIPPETVRAMLKDPELIRSISYRPAKSTVVRNAERNAAPGMPELARRLAYGAATTAEIPAELSAADRANLLELSFDYLEYLQESGRSPPGDAAGRGRDFLTLRQALGTNLPRTPVPVPALRPDQGHGSGKLTAAAGANRSGPFGEFGIRPAFHELLDPEAGYTRGAELRFFDLSFRENEERGLFLERFVPLEIRSLSPRSELFRPTSWRLKLGVERDSVRSAESEPLLATAEFGGGLTYELGSRGLVYGLAALSAQQSRYLKNNFQPGLGPELGFFYDVSQSVRVKADAFYRRLQEGERFHSSLNTVYSFSVQTAVLLELERKEDFGRWENELRLALLTYF